MVIMVMIVMIVDGGLMNDGRMIWSGWLRRGWTDDGRMMGYDLLKKNFVMC